jgi:hypothetical protein
MFGENAMQLFKLSNGLVSARLNLASAHVNS